MGWSRTYAGQSGARRQPGRGPVRQPVGALADPIQPMPMRSLSLLAAALPLASCAIVADDPRPSVRTGVELANKYVHRGMPQNQNGVVQGTLDVTLPTRNGQTLTVGTFANMDLTSSAGRAWFPSGHGGRVTELDLTATYAHSFENGVAMAAGVQNYMFPNGESFPNGAREQTNELFVHAQKEVLGAQVQFQLRHDFDQAKGTYVRLLFDEDFPIDDTWTVRLGSHVGYSSRAQSFWNYGLDAEGIADLVAHANLDYQYDAHTVVGVSLNAATIVDSGIREWMDLISIDSESYWLSVYCNWSF